MTWQLLGQKKRKKIVSNKLSVVLNTVLPSCRTYVLHPYHLLVAAQYLTKKHGFYKYGFNDTDFNDTNFITKDKDKEKEKHREKIQVQVQDEVKEEEEDVRENEEGISWIESYYKRFFEPHTQAEYSLLLFHS